MFRFLALALLLGSAASTPSPPLCHVTASGRPVPGLDSLLTGIGFRYLTVTAEQGCLPAHIALSNYGGRFTGEAMLLYPGQTKTFGPLPLYRKLLWFAASGASYDVHIHSLQGAP